MSAFAIYMVGLVVLLGGLVYGASLAGVPTHWIIVGAIVIAGAGILGAATRTRQKDPPET